MNNNTELKKIRKENEQLKSKNKYLQWAIDSQDKLLKRLEQLLEQINKEIKK